MHASSIENMQICLDKYGPAEGEGTACTVVDLGAADVNGSFRPLFEPLGAEYIGLDLSPGPGVDIVMADSYRVPLPDRSADIVLSGQALEHSEFFWLAFQEMVRLLKPEGVLFLIVPSAGPIHRYPVDCYRFYPDSLTALARFAECHLVDWWHDERGPWRDLVGVFSLRARPRQEGPIARATVKPPAPTPPSKDPAEEAMRGSVPYLEALGAVHRTLEPRLYLEIGIRAGSSFELATGRAVGVDPCPQVDERPAGHRRIFKETSDWFFALHAEAALGVDLDLAFIDGMHLFEFALRDFMNVERRSHPGTVVVCDDVFPNHPAQASRERRTRVWTGDVWKLIPCLRRMRPDLTLIPINAYPTGLLLIAGVDPENRLLWDNYNPVIRQFGGLADEPPEELLSRSGARTALSPEVEQLLADLRDARAATEPQAAVQRRLLAWGERGDNP